MSSPIVVIMSGARREECPQPGYVFRDRQSGRILTVVKADARHTGDETGSLGGKPWDEWLFVLECREATAEEAEGVRRDEAVLRRLQKELQREVRRLSEEAERHRAAQERLPELVRGLYWSGMYWSDSVLDPQQYTCRMCEGQGTFRDGNRCGYCGGTGRTSALRYPADAEVVLEAPGEYGWRLIRCRLIDGSEGYVQDLGSCAYLYANRDMVMQAVRGALSQPDCEIQVTLEKARRILGELRGKKTAESVVYRVIAGEDLEPEP